MQFGSLPSLISIYQTILSIQHSFQYSLRNVISGFTFSNLICLFSNSCSSGDFSSSCFLSCFRTWALFLCSRTLCNSGFSSTAAPLIKNKSYYISNNRNCSFVAIKWKGNPGCGHFSSSSRLRTSQHMLTLLLYYKPLSY